VNLYPLPRTRQREWYSLFSTLTPPAFIPTNRLKIRPSRLSCADTGSRIQSRAVTFKTIVPGWYSSRIIHIHVDSNALFVRLGAHLIHHATFFRSDANERADHFGFAVPHAAGRTPRTRRTASIPARRSCRSRLCYVHNSRRANNLAALHNLAHVFNM